MRPFGWIILAGTACQAMFWLRAVVTGRVPERSLALPALGGGAAVAAMAWNDSHAVLLAAQAMAMAAYIAALIKSPPPGTKT